MKLLYSTEERFLEYKGAFYGCGLSYELLQSRYLEVFDNVCLLVRSTPVGIRPEAYNRVDGPSVSVFPVQNYHGTCGFVAAAPRLNLQVRSIIADTDAIIVRVPSPIGTIVISEAQRRGRAYGLEVVGDPLDVFGPGAFPAVGRPLIRWFSYRMLRKQCRRAIAAAYVTARHLQERYPSGGWASSFSSIELAQSEFVSEDLLKTRFVHWTSGHDGGAWRLIFVGSLAHPYKGAHILLQAVEECIKKGYNLEVTIIGDGRYKEPLTKQSNWPLLRGRVRFLGYISDRDALLSELDRSDVFVLPSLAEGLPRAMIEAIARGLPCIGSRVGGIPELLPPEGIVPAKDARALAQRIAELISAPCKLTQMARSNYETAKEYEASILHQRRLEFYKYVSHSTTEEMLKVPK